MQEFDVSITLKASPDFQAYGKDKVEALKNIKDEISMLLSRLQVEVSEVDILGIELKEVEGE